MRSSTDAKPVLSPRRKPSRMESKRAVSHLPIAGGAVLVATGVVAYTVTDFSSMTALIPSVFGLLLVALGFAANREGSKKVPAYGVAGVAVLGALGSTRGVPDKISLLRGEPVETPVAAVSQGVMLLVCAVVVLGVVYYLVAEGRD